MSLIRYSTREDIVREWLYLAEPIEDEDDFTPVNPCRVPPANTVAVKPGNGNAAYKAGCEDEYANEMKARYGGEW